MVDEIAQLTQSLDKLNLLIGKLKLEQRLIYEQKQSKAHRILSEDSIFNLENAASELKHELLDQYQIRRLTAFIDSVYDANEQVLYKGSAFSKSISIPPLTSRPTRGSLKRGTKPKKIAKKPSQRPRRVNTGFASITNPDFTINENTALEANKDYYFWFTISFEKVEDSIEEEEIILQPGVPTEARLIIAIFGFQDGLLITKGADVGELELQKNGESKIINQPMGPNLKELEEQIPSAKKNLLKTRLFFPVKTPLSKGNFKMRCNIYWGQILLRSLLVHAEVVDGIESISEDKVALRTVADYTLTQTFKSAHLNQLKKHRLSIFLNSNGDGTHSFHVYGNNGDQKLKEDDIRFSEGELGSMIKGARMRLREASWGKKEEWQENKMKYKYRDRQPNLERLKKDLFNLASWGYEFYCQIKDRMAGGVNAVPTLEGLIAEPAFIQIAMKESPAHILPAAIIYDQRLVTTSSVKLCENFERSFLEGLQLEKCECFQGFCPNRENKFVLCPSGFWGFRHNLGMPLSIQKSSNVPPIISYQKTIEIAVGVATDLNLLDHHVQVLKNYKPDITWNYGDSSNKVFQYLKGSPHIVYFYCHGGELDGLPFLVVGPEQNKKGLSYGSQEVSSRCDSIRGNQEEVSGGTGSL